MGENSRHATHVEAGVRFLSAAESVWIPLISRAMSAAHLFFFLCQTA